MTQVSLRDLLPPLDTLVAFEAAARHASFTRAAGELHITQSAVAGHGIALGWRHLIDDLLARGALVRPLPHAVSTGYGYHLVRPDRDPPSAEARAFSAWVLAETGAAPAAA